jgi:hypothetical protein
MKEKNMRCKQSHRSRLIHLLISALDFFSESTKLETAVSKTTLPVSYSSQMVKPTMYSHFSFFSNAQGITDITKLVPEMNNHLSKIPATVSVHTFGFSAGHNAGFLTSISDAAKGMYYFVTESAKIPVLFAECLGGLLSTVAKDVKLTVVPAKGIKVHQIMTKYQVTEKGNEWIVDLGNVLRLIFIPSPQIFS